MSRARYLCHVARVLLLAVACCVQAEPRELTVGAILPLSGSASMFGLAAKNGLEMGLETRKVRPVRVIYEDNELSPAKSVSAFRKLSEVDKVAVIVTISATTANAIAPLAERDQVLLLAAASDRRVGQGRTYVIRTWCSGFEEGQRLANEIRTDKRTRVGLVLATSDYHLSVREGILPSLMETLVQDEEVGVAEMDFGGLALRAKSLQVDAVIALLGPGQLAAYAVQARRLGMIAPLYGAIQFENPEENTLAHGALTGAKYVTAWNTPEFVRRYTQRFSHGGIISLAAVHYELGRLLAEYSGPGTAEDVRTFIARTRGRRGALGLLAVTSDSYGTAFSVPLGIRQVER